MSTVASELSVRVVSLQEELRELFSELTRNISRAAEIVLELDRDGADVPLPASIANALRRVGNGAVDHRVLSCYLGTALFAKVSRLTLDKQRDLMDGDGKVKVARLDGDHRLLSVTELLPEECSLVFHGQSIRSIPDQLQVLRRREAREMIHKEDDTRSDIVIDMKGKGVVVRGRFCSVHELSSWLAELASHKR